MGRRKQRRTFPDLATFFSEGIETQAEFAARICKSQSYISNVVNHRIEPSLADALIIAKEAGVPLESLVQRETTLSGT